MKHRCGTLKCRAGKIVRACVDLEGEKIVNAVFTGDFFMDPDECIDRLGEALSNTPIKEKEIRDRIENFFSKTSLRLYGAEPHDFYDVIINILKARD